MQVFFRPNLLRSFDINIATFQLFIGDSGGQNDTSTKWAKEN